MNQLGEIKFQWLTASHPAIKQTAFISRFSSLICYSKKHKSAFTLVYTNSHTGGRGYYETFICTHSYRWSSHREQFAVQYLVQGHSTCRGAGDRPLTFRLLDELLSLLSHSHTHPATASTPFQFLSIYQGKSKHSHANTYTVHITKRTT